MRNRKERESRRKKRQMLKKRIKKLVFRMVAVPVLAIAALVVGAQLVFWVKEHPPKKIFFMAGPAVLKLVDKEPPVIEGVHGLTTTLGGSISYKRDVTVTDNMDDNVSLTVDTSQVNLYVTGEYPVVYLAVDKAGNVASASATVTVMEDRASNATEEQVNARADEILAEISTVDMNKYDKAKAIFSWVHDNVAWVDDSPKTDWVEGAYRGLVERRGDCFVYAMSAKCLLTRAGIQNMDIEKIPDESEHIWNIIDIGEGWRHFDATRRGNGVSFFYTSDAELMEYSKSHGNSHNYDPSKYPKIS